MESCYPDPMLGIRRHAYLQAQKDAMRISRSLGTTLKIAVESARSAQGDVQAELVRALDVQRGRLRTKGFADDVIDAGLARARDNARWREELASHPSRRATS